MVEGENNKSALYTLANPTGLAKKQKSYLQKWAPSEGTLVKAAELDESLSALAVRDDGRFVALGTMFSGSVSIYIAFSLQVFPEQFIFVSRSNYFTFRGFCTFLERIPCLLLVWNFYQ